jgi:hypothetical protein
VSSSFVALVLWSPAVSAQAPDWEAFTPFPDASSARSEAAAVVHDGTLYVLGGHPFRYEGGVVTGDPPERGAADYLPAGGGVWLQGTELDTGWGRMGLGVDGLGRLLGYGPASSGDPTATEKAFLYDVVGMTELQKVPGKWYSIPTGINEQDHVVGWGFGEWVYYPCCGQLYNGTIFRAFVNTDGNTRQLNEIIDAASGWNLTQAFDINDAGLIVGVGTVDGHNAAWLATPAEPSVCQTDLGFGGPGTAQLSLCGEGLATGQTSDLVLTDATPLVTSWMVLGLAAAPTPFKGGTLVPVPYLLAEPMPTSDQGGVAIPGVPGGNGPLTVYAQFVYPDPTAPKGWGFSNALEVVFEL